MQRGFRIFFLAMVVSAAVTVVAKSPPVDLRPNLAVSLVLSLIFGPFACLAANVVSSITNIPNNVLYKSCALYLVTVTVVTYFPYRV